METTYIYNKLIQIISQVTGARVENLVINTTLIAQGVDSLSFITILAKVEEEFDFEFGYDDIVDYNETTIKTLHDYIVSIKQIDNE